jgi:alkylhydroperoxidase/carboxymuconolactone decarboxylase family protein YurZ
MYLPDIFKTFKEQYPEIIDASSRLGELCAAAGPLDDKTKHLIQLGISVGAQSKGGVRSHARQALESGAATEEVLHAVLSSTSTVGFPIMIAAYGWVQQVVDSQDGGGE